MTPVGGKAVEPFTVMAKPVGPRCNLTCSYCYYLETEDMYEGRLPPKMSDALLETYIRQYIEASPGPVVSFTWHGGEPTLAGLDFYRKAVEFQRRYLPPGWSCWNNLQTNGTLLDDEWCSFLAEENFDVGLSIDGTPRTHDTYRKDHGGRGTHERVAAAARRLQAHGIQPDLLCTVTSTSAEEPVAIYRALRDLNTGWMQFIPIVRRDPDGRVTPDSVTPEGMATSMRSFRRVAQERHRASGDKQVAEMALVWSGGEANLCWMAPTSGRVLIVEQDGAVYSCDHFVSPEHRMGYIGALSQGEVSASAAGKSRPRRLVRWSTRLYSVNSVSPNGTAYRNSAALAHGLRSAMEGAKDRFATAEDGEVGPQLSMRRPDEVLCPRRTAS